MHDDGERQQEHERDLLGHNRIETQNFCRKLYEEMIAQENETKSLIDKLFYSKMRKAYNQALETGQGFIKIDSSGNMEVVDPKDFFKQSREDK